MSRKWFRFSLLLPWALCAAAVVAFFVEKPSLPPELRGYIDAAAERPVDGREEVLNWVLVLMVAVALVDTAGLYKFKGWARTLFLWYTAAAYCLCLLYREPVIAAPVTYVFYSLSSALNGFILALLYFSPVARYFEAGAPTPVEVLKHGRPES